MAVELRIRGRLGIDDLVEVDGEPVEYELQAFLRPKRNEDLEELVLGGSAPCYVEITARFVDDPRG